MQAADLFAGPRILSLCSGIGGLELGIEQATGARTICQVERDPFARAILARHWPGVKRMNDVRDVDSTFRGVADIVCGGFPCQPHSLAGSRKASEDDRDLWPEMARIMREVQPKAAIFENVPGLLTSRTDPKNDATKGHFFLRILRDLEAAGYMVRWDCCPASAVGALHRRDRVFIVATRGPVNGEPYPIAPESMWGHPQPLEWPRAGAWSGGAVYQAPARWPGLGASPWPTLSSRDWKSGKHGAVTEARNNSRPLNEVAWKEAGKPSDTPHLCPVWCESLMGFPHGWTEPEGDSLHDAPAPPALIGPHLVAARSVDRIRTLGNAVVPRVARTVAEVML